MKRMIRPATCLAAGCVLVLMAGPSVGEPPPKKPGPDYQWEDHRTTPEGHYVPGRWAKKMPAAPRPRPVYPPGTPIPPPVPYAPSGGMWVAPPVQQAPPPWYDYNLTVPIVPYVVPPLVGGSVYWHWGAGYPYYNRYGLYPYLRHGDHRYPHWRPPVKGFDFKPGPFEPWKKGYPGKIAPPPGPGPHRPPGGKPGEGKHPPAPSKKGPIERPKK